LSRRVAHLFALTLLAGILATPLRGQAPGDSLFRRYCASCHTIGTDRLVGPGLGGVNERRDRPWLLRQITEPDRMIASGDSIAERQVAEYGMPMPNLGLTRAQAESILEYIAAAGGATPSGAGPVVAEAATESQIALGRALFQGAARLTNGGP